MAKEKEDRKQPEWRYTRSRKESMKYAQQVAHVLMNIGKKYRNKEAHLFKAVPKPFRKVKPQK